jgi:hypothetical protein
LKKIKFLAIKLMNNTSNNLNIINKRGSIVIISSQNEYVGVVNGKASKIRNGNTSPIKYPIFDFYSQFARQNQESYWADLFMNASKGVFSNKMYKFNESTSLLTAKIGSVIHKCDMIPPSNDKFIEYYNKCKDFISSTSGAAITTADDFFLALPANKIENEPWTGSIPPYRQIAMIDIFCDDVSIKFSLSENTKKELKENLISKLFSGELNGENIHKVGHLIQYIDGLYFKDGKFSIQTNIPKTKNKRLKEQNTTYCEEKVENYIFKCSKNISNSLKNRSLSAGIN